MARTFAGKLVDAGRDVPEVFELAEVALDQLASAVDARIDGAPDFAIALGRDVGVS